MSIRDHAPLTAPTPGTVDVAQRALTELENSNSHVMVVNPATGTTIDLGDQLSGVMRYALSVFAQNKALSQLPHEDDLTPNQAAEILNVSRNYVMSRIETKELSAHMVGTHYRIKAADLVAFKNRSDAGAEVAMNELVAIEEEMGLD